MGSSALLANVVDGCGGAAGIFYLVDRANYRRAPRQVRAELAEPPDQWRFDGLWNVVYLAAILGAVFINSPIFLREAIMAGAAAGSYFSTRKQVHEANHFSFHPIREVAILFIGIFGTMIPALDWLQLNADSVAHPSPGTFYWGAGVLSSVLDNAPTYLSFLSASFGLFAKPEWVEILRTAIQNGGADLATLTGPQAEAIRGAYEALKQYHGLELASGNLTQDHLQAAFLLGNGRLMLYLAAISVASVFFGANTYIGNGPNFIVKSIADHQKVNTPGFFGLYS